MNLDETVVYEQRDSEYDLNEEADSAGYSHTEHATTYQKYLDKMYLITKEEIYINESLGLGEGTNFFNYSSGNTLNNNYYKREFTSDANFALTIDEKYYQISQTDYGVIVEYLDFNNE